MRRFEGKVALVTGAASGIGKATAARLAEEGAKVATIDVTEGGADFRCDVSDEAEVARTVAAVIARFERLDVVCNVAGILRADHTLDLTLDNWNRILRVNLTGTFLVCRATLPHLVQTKGNIVNTSSTAALGSHPWMAA
jgi:NAD(P)-dependent dehydrogenase (short-subunit alcohol dehydrogenase family)